MKVFIVGRTTAETDQGNVWEVMGVFATEDAAVDACAPSDWVGPIDMDVLLPDAPVQWPDAYYPHAAPTA